MANNTTIHCPLSRCELEPGYCETHLSSSEYMLCALIVGLPILIAFFAPGIARSGKACRGDDDTPELRYNEIDPPMFLCGIGLLPYDCGLSGLLTVIAAMMFAFVTVFFSLLNTPHPCRTAVGSCRTISCACGNLMPEGYVFMFCLLLLTSLILVQRWTRMRHHNRIQHRVLKPCLILGSLLLTLTGIFPERYDSNGLMGGYLYYFYGLHLLGVFGSGVLLLNVPFLWFAEHWYTHRQEVPLRSLVARLAYFLACNAFGIGFCLFANESQVVDMVVHYCGTLSTKAACEGWPMLTPTECTRAEGCLPSGGGGDDSLCSSFVQPNFECAWQPNVGLSPWMQLVSSEEYNRGNSCVRHTCPLSEYARGVALEFALLFLTLTYVSSFGLHDCRRLLDRPPKSARASIDPLSGTQPLELNVEAPTRGLLPPNAPIAAPLEQQQQSPYIG